ncbi:MAG: M15 family metallopeptidase [Lachnospiraceae bacterium]|nr:M15 family metallopeptidase [Lachnospiraceae bacterium]
MGKDHTITALFILLPMLLCACKETGIAATTKTDTDTVPTPAVIVIEDDTSPVKTSEEDSFYEEEITDELFARMKGKSFPDDCTTDVNDLRYLHLLYIDFDGNTCVGEMVCNRVIADKLIDIFRQLYEAEYPIEKIRLIDDYDGDDDASMADNNTSCFNFRVVEGSTNLSKHAFGAAVDLNPLYNPYIRQKEQKTVVEPPEGKPYADRTVDFEHKIDKNDLAYKLFTEAGFTWGGSWKSVKDYQHFQIDIP